MNDNFKFAMLFPILAILCIVAYAGSLGVIFMIIDTTALEEIGVGGWCSGVGILRRLGG